MDASVGPLFAATVTAAGILSWLSSRPRVTPAYSADLNGGGVLDDMYESATLGLRRAKRATSDMWRNVFAKKDAYGRQSAAAYSRYGKRAKAARDAASLRYRNFKNEYADRYRAASEAASARLSRMRN